MSAAPSLSEIAAELYTQPLGEFIAARNARAADASDKAMAAGIRALCKPSVAAWVVNVFARERASQLGEALQLAAELREAQEDLDAKALAQLGRDRRALTARLAAAAADLAESRGERITASTRDAVQQTISAAFFDPDAAAAVASGRLVRELEPTGTFADAMDSIVGGGTPSAPTEPPAPPDELKARRARRDAERALREAEQTRDRAARDAAKAERVAKDAASRAGELTSRVAELEKELDSARREAKRAETDAADARERRAEASRAADETEDAVTAARSALEKLERAR
ncbi:transposase [Microbacterium hydrocarbonoxydans]|uniref:transposase n=1 Tax=Microbacterium hydrocarbonoxydans TaxID=273678 RepID=UPI00203BE91C|nr:transposase [Microbacterium hydrocarbonoxydans]MCM3779089.1 transposase [Microbacterium hydrocarbonoxydans]